MDMELQVYTDVCVCANLCGLGTGKNPFGGPMLLQPGLWATACDSSRRHAPAAAAIAEAAEDGPASSEEPLLGACMAVCEYH